MFLSDNGIPVWPFFIAAALLVGKYRNPVAATVLIVLIMMIQEIRWLGGDNLLKYQCICVFGFVVVSIIDRGLAVFITLSGIMFLLRHFEYINSTEKHLLSEASLVLAMVWGLISGPDGGILARGPKLPSVHRPFPGAGYIETAYWWFSGCRFPALVGQAQKQVRA